MRMQTPALLFSLFPTLSLAALPPALSTFSSSTESWTLHTYAGSQPGPTSYTSPTSTSTPPREPTAGHPDAYLRISDPNSDWSYFSAPSPFLGDHSNLYGVGLLSFSQRWFNPHIEPAPFHHHVVLISGSTVLRSLPGTYPNDTWQSLQFPFTPANWRFGTATNAPNATEAQLRSVLSNITKLLIYAEFGNQVQEIVGLDTVRLALYGDANMSGRIDPDDLALTDRGHALNLSTWSNGDFNEDGAVNSTDYSLLHASLQSQPGYTAAPAIVPVPEPLTSGLLAALALPVLSQSRRRRSPVS